MRERQTRQLKTIEEVLRAAHRPLAIPEIHEAAREKLEGLGVATVYRAVRELTAAGSIVNVEYAGQPTRYEWAVARHHAHFICHRCKRVFDIEAPDDIPAPKRKPKGFQFSGSEVVYYGLCADCRSA